MFDRAGAGGPSYSDPSARSFTDPYAVGSYSAGDPKYADLEHAIYQDQAMQFEPQFAQQNRDFENKFAARGLPVGGEAYDTQYANMADAQNRARIMAANQATMAGRTAFENDRNFAAARNQEAFGRGEATRSADQNYALQKFGALTGQDNQTYNRLAALLSLIPNANAPQLDVTTPYQMKQTGDMAKYQGQLSAYNSGMGGLLDLAGALGTAAILA